MSRMSLRRTYQTNRLSFIFGWAFPIAGADWTPFVHPIEIPSTSSDGREYSRETANHPKTDSVVAVVRVVIGAKGRPTVQGKVVPRTAPQQPSTRLLSR